MIIVTIRRYKVLDHVKDYREEWGYSSTHS
jgi:hypothetical protein